jgi:serine/threonine protein kinase
VLPRNVGKSESEPDDVKITLIDFNVSRRFREKIQNKGSVEIDSPAMRNLLMLTNTGAAAFTAPEINLGYSYTEKVDMWGVGCILYNAIFNDIPFP